MEAKFKKHDKIVIIDHHNKQFMWNKGTIISVTDDDNISVLLDNIKIRITVNDRQLMHYSDIKDMAGILGFEEDDFTEWDKESVLPPTPDQDDITSNKNGKCICEYISWGCRCEYGKKELEMEKRRENE